MIALFYFYIVHPEKIPDMKENLTGIQETVTKIQNKITDMVAEEPAPSSPETAVKTESAIKREFAIKRETPPPMDFATSPEPVRPKPAEYKKADIILNGAGLLPDFTTAAKKKPSLNAYTADANKMIFETLNTYHKLVKDMIAEWAEETDEQKIAEIVQMPYKQFFAKTSASLLSQTLLRKSGLTPVNTDQMISESPIQAMAFLYSFLRNAMLTKESVPEQIRTIEPVTSFLLYVCHDDSECLGSWDLLLDMLGVKQFAKRLELAPETIYTEK